METIVTLCCIATGGAFLAQALIQGYFIFALSRARQGLPVTLDAVARRMGEDGVWLSFAGRFPASAVTSLTATAVAAFQFGWQWSGPVFLGVALACVLLGRTTDALVALMRSRPRQQQSGA